MGSSKEFIKTEGKYKGIFLYEDSILRHSDILAFYGHPLSRNMGILGRYAKEELYNKLSILADEYRDAGGRNIVKAFYIIFGTVWPEAQIGIIRETLLKEWVEFALERDMLIFLDHQMGKYSPEEGIRTMLPWLKHPNVHLALDPEWRTLKPMKEIGHITGEELNHVQQIMEDYLTDNQLPGERFLVIHQFNQTMLRNRADIRSDFSRVRFVHCVSGIGTPTKKKETYALCAQAANLPVKGFKLWFDLGISGHADKPLMTPLEVMQLAPRPFIVMY
jgi:hypothetical protein